MQINLLNYIYLAYIRIETFCGRKKRPISINNESSLQLPESKGIELKSFSFNINYDRVTGVVVMDS